MKEIVLIYMRGTKIIDLVSSLSGGVKCGSARSRPICHLLMSNDQVTKGFHETQSSGS